MLNEKIGGAFDKEEKTLIPYELFGADAILPNKFILDDYLVNNQGRGEYTYSCVFFGEANSINEIRGYLGINNLLGEVKGEMMADYAEATGRLDKNAGAYLIDGPKVAKELGLIDGYVGVSSLDDFKKAIYEGMPIGVGSSKINWKETLISPFIVKEGNSYGHKFIIIGWDDEKQVLVCENSYGKELFDNGRFYLPYNLINLLFNTKTANYVNDFRFKKLNEYLRLAKIMGYRKFYDLYIKDSTDGLNKGLAMLAAQIRFIGRINSKELLELIK